MKRFVTAVIVILCGMSAQAQTANPATKKVNDWWHTAYLTQPLNSPDAKKLPLISVSGNRFVDPAGKPVLFRGVSIADPDKVESQGHWNKDFFVKVKETGATVVRIPVHPAAWRGRGTRNYLALLDQAVQWCTDLGLYVDIDWHSIGNLKQGLFQDPMYETSLPETFNFWRTIAAHYNGNHTVAFFELFNEPTVFFGRLGSMSWEDWRQINEDMVSLIRAYDKETIPLVAGFDWAYDLTPLRISPIRADNLSRQEIEAVASQVGRGFRLCRRSLSHHCHRAWFRLRRRRQGAGHRVRQRNYKLPRIEGHQLDRLVLRSGVGPDHDLLVEYVRPHR
jgi:hypothetical protein